ncbi:hypothetical protein A7U60_g7992 [Sanghuangporus baumii]|uniref:Uncharacterized protein n=1 Tax=Sanghuangporus baumii TaxID=108892 RepID=A0A9Q5MZ73_SANBA|nr:hypothetical protein A7U60_g7992 [Sanghuangporus baumii]
MSVLNASMPLQIRSDADAIDPSVVQLFISESTTVQYFNVALVTVIVYHSIITLDKEVKSHRNPALAEILTRLFFVRSQIKYFWLSPCSSVSIVYFASTDLQRASEGRFLFWAGGLADLATIVLIDYILLIRVLALWDKDKKLSIALKILLGLEAGLGLGILIYSAIFEEIAVGSLAEGMTICVGHRNPPRTMAIISWLIPMTYGSILLCLALYKATEYWKLSAGFKGFHLIVDISIVGINLFAANLLSAAGSPTLLCVLGGQLLINLKQAGEKGLNGGTNYMPRSVSDIDFGENGVNDEQLSGQEGSV